MTQHSFPSITPLPSETARPFWSVMIPTYNRTKYLQSALSSVLGQLHAQGRHFGPSEMQIEVVDNASTNSEVEALVRDIDSEAGGGRVSFFRQASNISIAGNWNACVERARGRWIHILHDDDEVLPGFYSSHQKLIEEHAGREPPLGMVISRPILIDEDGEWHHIMRTPPSLQKTGLWPDALFGLVSENTSDFLRCPAIVVARRAYEEVGGFDPGSNYTLDWQMWIRVAAAFSVGYIHQPQALYRQHRGSATYNLIGEQDLIADIERTARHGLSLLPPERREAARVGADAMAAHIAFMFREHLHRLGQHRGALKYSRHLYRHAPSRRNSLLLLKSLARAMKAQALSPPASK